MIKGLLKILFLVSLCYASVAQNCMLKSGDKAGPIVLMNNQNALMSLTFPYYSKIVLVHFWSSSVGKSKQFIPRSIDLFDRYNSTAYRNAEGFEVITVAVQSDKTAWRQDLLDMKMDKGINLIASKGYNDMSVCNFKITQLPVTVLIDEVGSVLLINPTQLQIEEVLDSKKNSPTNTRDIRGTLLSSENSKDIVKDQKMVMLNKFYDTISRTVTDATGRFTFTGVKYLTEYVLKIDTTGLGSKAQTFIAAGGGTLATIPKTSGKFEYKLNLADVAKMTGLNKETTTTKNAISFNVNIAFKKNTPELEEASLLELDKVAAMLSKNKDYTLEIISHTDSKGDDADNLELSKKRSSSVKAYLVSKGISPSRMKPIGKGETEIKNKCKNNVTCTAEEHAENVRTELKFYKP